MNADNMGNEHYSLHQLNLMVRDAIEMHLPDEYWVEAELSECRERGGHCYMELVEKEESTHTPIARASAKCWRQTWQILEPYFERVTSQPLRAGLKVLLKVYAQYHEAYGFSWIVTDIDPTYTIGDMARKRQEIIRKLKEEGVFDLQKELQLPLFCQRIAVISAEGAAGYGDFVRQLEDNPYGLHFDITLFPAIMQGEQVEQSVIAALEEIYIQSQQQFATPHSALQRMANTPKPFDVVCILRGGGATADLSGFDTLALAEHVANFPLPIITGIGHDRDESILDMVSHIRVKTPTAAAALLIDHLQQVLLRIENAQQRITTAISQKLSTQGNRLSTLQTLIPTLALRILSDSHHRIEMLGSRIPIAIERRLTSQKHRLESITLQLQSFDPQLLISRGYSITTYQGKVIRDPSQLKAGDEIETRVEKGKFKAIVQ